MATFKNLKMKLLIGGEIETLTGIHIGGNDAGLGIGGADRLVVRNPRDNRPYIPGSSVKGKLRSLLERSGEAKVAVKEEKDEKGNVVGFTVKPCECGQCQVCFVFGVPAGETKYEEGRPSAGTARLIVRDSHLIPESAIEMEKWRHLDMPYTEIKTEVSIDRLTSAANPRQFERVPAGARFDLSLVLNVFEGDNNAGKDHLNLVLKGLDLLSYDYLGGQGSRGYGAVKITITSIRGLDIDEIRDKKAEPRDCASTYALAVPLTYDSRVPKKKVA